MSEIKIFLASSSELKEEREQFEIFINRKNKEWYRKGAFLNLILWEDFIDSMSQTRLQDEYNKAVRTCDIFVMLFYTKVGKYTLEEFGTAFGQFRESGRPLIYTYFKNSDIRTAQMDRENIMSLWAFQDKLKELGHFQTIFNNTEDLKLQFTQQLEKLVDSGFIRLEPKTEPEKGKPAGETGVSQPQKKNINPKTQADQLIGSYLDIIGNNYKTLSMIGVGRHFDMDRIYIPLTVHVDKRIEVECRAEQMPEKYFEHTLKAEELVGLPEKVAVVLGDPGMGKSTMQKYLARRESTKSNPLIPIFVRLSDYSKSRMPLEAYLLGEVEQYIPGADMQEVVLEALKGGKVLVLLDGLDEVPRGEYTAVTDRINTFISSHRCCRVIITSRKAGFKCHEVPYRVFELDKLPIEEMEKFIDKWFDNKSDLIERIKGNHRIYELAQNPFLLSIICVVYGKDKSLPERRVELYRRCTTALLTLYDEKNLDKKNLYARWLKEQILCDAAYTFFVGGADEFLYKSLVMQVSQTLAADEQKKNINEDEILLEICENSGLLQKSEERYMFIHRSFYEYYTSCKMREQKQEKVLSCAGDARWEEPIRLYAAQIENTGEGTAFFKRLWEKDRALALRCYPDMDKVVEADLIQKLLGQADEDIGARVELVKGLKEKMTQEKVVETLKVLFNWETNGEVIYWGVQTLEELKDVPEALEIVGNKLDKGARQRYMDYIEGDMKEIPEGTFMMGSENKEGEDDERPLHKVKLNRFYMSRYQVTNRLYEIFDPNHKKKRDEYSNEDEQPAVYVNWYEAAMFCRWLGCRLPTEAEWEYACRAGTTTLFYTGDNLITNQANYNRICGGTTPVGSYVPNGRGLFDMHGNVWEWCVDGFDEKYYKECKINGVVENPKVSKYGSRHVLRGGGWRGHAWFCRSGYRYPGRPGSRDSNVGFRPVFVPQAEAVV